MAFAYKLAAAIAAGGSAYSTVSHSQCKDAEKPDGKGWFDPEALERGAKAIREIDRSTNAKKVRLAPAATKHPSDLHIINCMHLLCSCRAYPAVHAGQASCQCTSSQRACAFSWTVRLVGSAINHGP